MIYVSELSRVYHYYKAKHDYDAYSIEYAKLKLAMIDGAFVSYPAGSENIMERNFQQERDLQAIHERMRNAERQMMDYGSGLGITSPFQESCNTINTLVRVYKLHIYALVAALFKLPHKADGYVCVSGNQISGYKTLNEANEAVICHPNSIIFQQTHTHLIPLGRRYKLRQLGF